jgi:hypothetical protein
MREAATLVVAFGGSCIRITHRGLRAAEIVSFLFGHAEEREEGSLQATSGVEEAPADRPTAT